MGHQPILLTPFCITGPSAGNNWFKRGFTHSRSLCKTSLQLTSMYFTVKRVKPTTLKLLDLSHLASLLRYSYFFRTKETFFKCRFTAYKIYRLKGSRTCCCTNSSFNEVLLVVLTNRYEKKVRQQQQQQLCSLRNNAKDRNT